MADEKIVLNLEIKARGATGVTTEVRKVVGTVSDLQKELTNLAKPASGFGNTARKQFKSIRDSLVALQAEAVKTGKALEKVDATNVGTKKAKVKGTVSTEGTELKRIKELAKAEREAANEKKKAMTDLEQFQARFAKAEERRRKAEAQDERDAVAARVRGAQNRLAARAREKREEANVAKQKANDSRRTATARFATAGFLGLNLAQQMDGALDGIKAKGMLAPVMGEIFGAFGDLFGTTMGAIFGNIAKGVGKLIESVFDVIGAGFIAGLKFVSGMLTGIGTALIAVVAIPISGLLIGAIGGFFIGLLKAATSLLNDLFQIVGNVMSAIGNLITAALQVVKAVFDGFMNVVKGLWTAFWTGLKGIAEFSMQAIAEITNTVLDQIGQGFMDFVEAERLATKSFINISSEVGKGSATFKEGAEATRKLGSEMRRTFAASGSDAQGAIFDVLSGGFSKITDAQMILGSAGKLAAIGQDTLKDSTASVASVLLAYGKGATEAEGVAATLNSISKVGRFDLGGLSKALPNVINSAASAQVPLNELGAVLGLVSQTGVPVQEAATGINRLLLAMISPTRQNRQAFAELGLSFTKVGADGKVTARSFSELIQEFKKIPDDKVRKVFGTSEGIRVFRALSNNAEKFKEVLSQINSGTKLFGKDFEDASGTFAFMFEKVKQIGLTIREGIGGAFGELIRGPLKLVIPLIENIAKVMDSEKVTKFFKAFQTYAQPIVDSVLAPFVNMLKDISGALTNSSFEGIFNSDGAISFRETILNIIANIKEMPAALNKTFGIFQSLKGVVSVIFTQILIPALKFMADPENYNAFIKGLTTAVGYAVEIKDAIMGAFNNPDAAVEFFNNLMTAAGNSFMAIGSFLIEVLKRAFTIVTNFLQASIVSSLVDGIREALQAISLNVAGAFNKQAKDADDRIEERKKNGKSLLGGLTFEQTKQNTVDAGIASSSNMFASMFGSIGGALRTPDLKNDSTQERLTASTFGGLLNNLGAEETKKLDSTLIPSLANSSGESEGAIMDTFDKLKKGETFFNGSDKAILKSLAAELQGGSSLSLLKADGETGLANKLGSAGKSIRVGSEQSRASDALNASVPNFLPAVKADFGAMILELKEINKNTLKLSGGNGPKPEPITAMVPSMPSALEAPPIDPMAEANKTRYGVAEPFKFGQTASIAKGLDFEYGRKEKGANNDKTIERLMNELIKINAKIERHAAMTAAKASKASVDNFSMPSSEGARGNGYKDIGEMP